MKKILTLVLLIVVIALTGCTESVESFNNIKKDDTILEFLQENYGVTEITNITLEKRQTNKEKKQDIVYCNITSQNDTDRLNGNFLLRYNYYDKGGWVLESIKENSHEWTPLAFDLSPETIFDEDRGLIYNVNEILVQRIIDDENILNILSLELAGLLALKVSISGTYMKETRYIQTIWSYDKNWGKWLVWDLHDIEGKNMEREINKNIFGTYTCNKQSISYSPKGYIILDKIEDGILAENDSLTVNIRDIHSDINTNGKLKIYGKFPSNGKSFYFPESGATINITFDSIEIKYDGRRIILDPISKTYEP